MEESYDAEHTFEAVKIAMTQDKNGHVLRLSIHPDDTPEAIMRDPVGTRYKVGVYRMGDTDAPVPSKDTEEGMKAVKMAGVLCASEEFQEWLLFRDEIEEASEEAATLWMREKLGVKSRTELRINKAARGILAGIVESYRGAR